MLSLRKKEEAEGSQAVAVRKFIIPEINTHAYFYYHLVDFDKVHLTEPPAIKSTNDGGSNENQNKQACG